MVCLELLMAKMAKPVPNVDPSNEMGKYVHDYFHGLVKVPGLPKVSGSPRAEDNTWNTTVLHWDNYDIAIEMDEWKPLEDLITYINKVRVGDPIIQYMFPPPGKDLRIVFDSPVTEVLLYVFPNEKDMKPETKKAWEPLLSRVFKKGDAHEYGLRDEFGGWGLTANSNPPAADYAWIDQKGSIAWVHYIGWGAYVQSKKWRESQSYKEAAKLLDNKGWASIINFHYWEYKY